MIDIVVEEIPQVFNLRLQSRTSDRDMPARYDFLASLPNLHYLTTYGHTMAWDTLQYLGKNLTHICVHQCALSATELAASLLLSEPKSTVLVKVIGCDYDERQRSALTVSTYRISLEFGLMPEYSKSAPDVPSFKSNSLIRSVLHE